MCEVAVALVRRAKSNWDQRMTMPMDLSPTGRALKHTVFICDSLKYARDDDAAKAQKEDEALGHFQAYIRSQIGTCTSASEVVRPDVSWLDPEVDFLQRAALRQITLILVLTYFVACHQAIGAFWPDLTYPWPAVLLMNVVLAEAVVILVLVVKAMQGIPRRLARWLRGE